MIEINRLLKGQKIIRHWPEGDTRTSEFIIREVYYDQGKGWVAEVDWCDDDYSTKIYEHDQNKYEYDRRWKDIGPKEINKTSVKKDPLIKNVDIELVCYQIEIIVPQGTHSYIYSEKIISDKSVKEKYGLFARVGNISPLMHIVQHKQILDKLSMYDYQEKIE